MPKGFANEIVAAIEPTVTGFCHPQQSKRTKCRCGRVLQLSGTTGQFCTCGRVHRKAPGSAFASTGFQPVRPGGSKGCPGCD